MTQSAPGPLLGRLYVQVLIGIVLGIAVGALFPRFGAALAPIADAFIKLIKMLLGPIIFGTVVTGIARMGDMRSVGRIGLKAIVYFELVSTLALIMGLVFMNLVKPGAGMNIDASALDAGSIATFAAAKPQGAVGFLLDIIPTTLVDAFAKGAMLQIIFISLLVGIALASIGARGEPLLEVIDLFLQVLFRIVGYVMYLAPLAAGAGIAFTIGRYGFGVLASLGALIATVWGTAILFVIVVLGAICWLSGFSLWRYLAYIREEVLIVFATCSTEAVLPAMLAKLEAMGAEKSVVGMVLPAGYTFNADGTSMYLTGAALFIAQATNTPLSLGDQIELQAILLLTSKGSAGVAGAGFVTLAATLSALHSLPVTGIVLLLGVDRFLNVPRAVVNLIGNGIATLVVARWDGALDRGRLMAALAAKTQAAQNRIH